MGRKVKENILKKITIIISIVVFVCILVGIIWKIEFYAIGKLVQNKSNSKIEEKGEGDIGDKSFIFLHDRDCVFRFTAYYDYNGDIFDVEEEETVYVMRDNYWELHRKF